MAAFYFNSLRGNVKKYLFFPPENTKYIRLAKWSLRLKEAVPVATTVL
jgi:hypothetical protein